MNNRRAGRMPRSATESRLASTATEDLLSGSWLLRRAFLDTDACLAPRGATVIHPNQPDPPAFLLDRGAAYSSTRSADGGRAITDIHLPGDIVGMEGIVMGRAAEAVIAADDLRYRRLDAAAVRKLMAHPQIAMRILALAGEDRRRTDRHIIGLTSLDARERLIGFLYGVYERLRRRDIIDHSSFNLPLTREEIADHLGVTVVHVNRSLRRLREEKLMNVDRQVVTVLDLEGLRQMASVLQP